MNFPRRTNRRPEAVLAFALLVLIALIAGVVALFFPSFFPSGAHAVGKPLWQGNHAATLSLSDFFGLLHSKRELILQNRALSASLDEANTQLATLALVTAENTSLKSLLGREDSSKSLVAAVLARPNVSPYDTLLIDAGSAEGVSEGDIVYVAGNVALGRIERVHTHTALAALFSTPGTKTVVQVGSAHLQVEATGKGGGNFEARLPRETAIMIGDSINIPGINPLLFATVEHIESEPSDPFQVIYFKNPVNLHEIQFVQLRHS